MNLFTKLTNRLTILFGSIPKWKNIEYFDLNWETRVGLMAKNICEGESVMDLGCGQMILQKYLKNNKYIPVDYRSRDTATIICDFNKKEFPKEKVDIVFISGCMEYVNDPAWFIKMSCSISHKVILSYCCVDEFPRLTERKRNYWVNNLSASNILNYFYQNNFVLISTEIIEKKDRIMVFVKI